MSHRDADVPPKREVAPEPTNPTPTPPPKDETMVPWHHHQNMRRPNNSCAEQHPARTRPEKKLADQKQLQDQSNPSNLRSPSGTQTHKHPGMESKSDKQRANRHPEPIAHSSQENNIQLRRQPQPKRNSKQKPNFLNKKTNLLNKGLGRPSRKNTTFIASEVGRMDPLRSPNREIVFRVPCPCRA